jgi:hypothetical protein
MGIIDRLGKLEGLLMGLQASIVQSQAQVTGFMSRVESLERRLVELEKVQVTRTDLEALGAKVDALAVSDARSRGGVGVAGYLTTTIIALIAAGAAWAALERSPVYLPSNQAPHQLEQRRLLP